MSSVAAGENSSGLMTRKKYVMPNCYAGVSNYWQSITKGITRVRCGENTGRGPNNAPHHKGEGISALLGTDAS